MINLLAYTHPEGRFEPEAARLVKLQIENARAFFDPADILLVTNFPYEHAGVKAMTVPSLDCRWDRTSNKILVIQHLLNEGLTGSFWYHDLDAYQDADVSGGESELGLTDYGYKDQINGGSFFFTDKAAPAFDTWVERTLVHRRTRADEKTMTDMVREGLPHTLLNITYNFGQRCPAQCFELAELPLRVLHFHPEYRYYRAKRWNLPIFMYGRNPQGRPLMSPRLIALFQAHGFQ